MTIHILEYPAANLFIFFLNFVKPLLSYDNTGLSLPAICYKPCIIAYSGPAGDSMQASIKPCPHYQSFIQSQTPESNDTNTNNPTFPWKLLVK